MKDINQIDPNQTHDISATFFTFGSRALPAEAACKINVLGEDRHPLGVNGAQVGVFKQTNDVNLTRFLKSMDGSGLEAQIAPELLGDLAHKALEREPAHRV